MRSWGKNVTMDKSIQELQVDNNIIDDQQQIANKFNDFFINVGPNLATKIPGSNKSVSDYQKKSYNNSIFLAPTSVAKILNIIQDLKISSNADQNEIPVVILKQCGCDLPKYWPTLITNL